MSIYFGQQQTFCTSTINGISLYLKIPILGEQSTSSYPEKLGKVDNQKDFHLLETESLLIGALAQPITYPLNQPIYKIYQNLLELTQER